MATTHLGILQGSSRQKGWGIMSSSKQRPALLSAIAVLLAGALVACAPAAQPPGGSSSSASGAASSGGGTTGVAPAPKQGGNLTFALSRDITRKGLDPNVGGGQPDILIWTQLYDTLVYQDPRDHSIKPGLAESWEVSEDGKVYTFHLRKDVKFHDGTPFNAEAVKFVVDRIKEPSNPGISRQHLAEVQTTEVVDDYTVRVTLRNAQPIFLLRLTRPHNAMVSPTAVRTLGPEEFGRKPVGSGPFMFQDWVPGDRFVLKRNPDYKWGPSFFRHQGPPYLDTVTIRIIPEASTRVAALETGEVDAIDFVPSQELESLKRNSSYRVETTQQSGGPIVLHLNLEMPPTNELAVRRALILATDRESINQTAYLGAQLPAYGFLQPQMHGYAPHLEARLRPNPEEAKRVLDEAGWRVGPDGIRVKDGRPLELRGLFTGSPPLAYELLQAQWRAVGVRLNIQFLNRAGYQDSAERGQGNVYGEVTGGFTNEDPDLLRLVYACATVGGRNYSRYCNPELDRLLQEAYLTPFGERRASLYHQVQEILVNDAVAVPFIGENYDLGLRSYVRDIWTNALGIYAHFVDTWLDK